MNTSRGFVPLLIIIVCALLVAVGVGAYVNKNLGHVQSEMATTTSTESVSPPTTDMSSAVLHYPSEINETQPITTLALVPSEQPLPTLWYCVRVTGENAGAHLSLASAENLEEISNLGKVSSPDPQSLDLNKLKLPNGHYYLRLLSDTGSELVYPAPFSAHPFQLKGQSVTFDTNFSTSARFPIYLAVGQTLSDGKISIKLISVKTDSEGPLANLLVSENGQTTPISARGYWQKDFAEGISVSFGKYFLHGNAAVILDVFQTVESTGGM